MSFNSNSKKGIFLNLAGKTASMILKETNAALATANKELKNIINIPRGEKRTRANTLEPLNRITIVLGEARYIAGLFSAVHPDKKVRDASEKAIQKLAKFFPRLYLRPDIYEAVRAVSPEFLDKTAKRYREKELLDFKLSGVDKPAAVREKIKRLVEQSVKLGQAFDRNIKDDVRKIAFAQKDLEGLPEDFKKSHPASKEGESSVTTNYPDYFPFMTYAKNDIARKKLYLAFTNRAWPKNDKIFQKLLAVRDQQAKLIGFRHWADYITADKMSKSADTVEKFLKNVTKLTEARAKEDSKILLERKKKDFPNATSVEMWESRYYTNLVQKEKIGFDALAARNYFQFKEVKKGLFKMMGRLFKLSFRLTKQRAWHPDVEVYDVYRGKKLIGRFYLDLHPRDGKYGHAACFDVRAGIRGKQLPEAALICNFSRDLMEFGDVETFFHEFGHLMHYIIAGDHEWARFSGFATEWDFVEAPSQMLEEWAWDLKTLQNFAFHKETGKPIDRDLITRMQKSDSFARGIWIRTQVFQAMISLKYHSQKISRTSELLSLMRREQKKFSLFNYVPGSHFYANFGHLNGYSAIYYTYLWSQSIGRDLLSRFEKEGMYGVRVSHDYTNKVLAPGGSKDARELVRDFLGREWNLNAFKKWINKK